MKRGEIWWAQIAPPIGDRPVVLVSREAAYAIRTSVIVAEVTTKIRGIPVEVRIGPAEGLRRESVVNADTLMSVRIDQLQRRLGELTQEQQEALDRAMMFALGLSY